MKTFRWSIGVSAETDRAVRMFMAARGGGRKGDLSRFIQEAIEAYLLEQTNRQMKEMTEQPCELESEVVSNTCINEAVDVAQGDQNAV